MSETPSPRPLQTPEAVLGAQIVSLGARWLRIAYRAALAWWRRWNWSGRYGVIFFAAGVAGLIAGCPLWAPALPSDLFTGLGGIFCTWGACWAFGDAWGRAGKTVRPSSGQRSEHTPPGECP